ncbi:enoyl-CoA hydratase/isomerase family protein [Salinisphaera aquimarina]|uniref:Enoyl-CoA hydratase/isomerase family protein n=1 Tax=Salinisphaera aquimarina TaxID=2094031 RepID=A0ABV7EUB9_9GAMM
MSEDLSVQSDGAFVTITLDRSDKRNALSGDLVEALIMAVDEAHTHQAEGIVFRGNGKNFSAGFDFSGWREQSEGDLVLRFIRIETLLQKIATSPALTIGLAHGRNFGAGVDLFGVCRWRVATEDATFRMPGLKFGLVLGTRRFAECVGDQSAREILSSTRTFDAHEARDIGFVTDHVAQGKWNALLDTANADKPDPARALLSAALCREQPDTDLAQLVRSASRPGLKGRIAAYLDPAT